MYNRVSFPKTPKWARHLKRLANVSKLPLDPCVAELARTYSYSAEDLHPTVRFSKRECDALQYVVDWKGRCVLVDTKLPTYSRIVLMMAAKLLDSKSLLILTKGPTEIDVWTQLIRLYFPDDAVVHIDDKRNRSSAAGNPEEAPRVWVLASQREALDNHIIGEYKTDHLVLEMIDTQVHYESTEAINGMFLEIPRATVLARSQEFWLDPQDPKSSSSIDMIIASVVNYTRTNNHMVRAASGIGTSQSVSMYFRARGVKLDALKLLEASGVCLDLVVDQTSVNFKNIMNSTFVGELGVSSKRRSEIVQRHLDREALVARSFGSLTAAIDAAVAGDSEARRQLDGLKTQDWSKLKANTFFNLLQAPVSREEKTLIVTKNPHIQKYMNMSVGAALMSNENDVERAKKYSDFCYPGDGHRNIAHLPEYHKNRMTNRLIVDDITALDPQVFESVEKIVFTEFPYDIDQIADYIELSKAFRFKMIFGTMRGTFEEILAERLLTPHY